MRISGRPEIRRGRDARDPSAPHPHRGRGGCAAPGGGLYPGQRILPDTPRMTPTPDPAPVPARDARPGLVATYRRLWPYLWPYGRPDLQRRVFLAFGLLLVAKLVTMVTPFTFKWITDALVAAVGGREGRPHRPLRRADAADRALRRLAHPDGGADAGARRALRQGGDACGAPPCAEDLPAHAPALLALPPRAQDRRPDAGAGARALRHRGIVAPDGADAGADHRRVRPGARRAGLASSTGPTRPSCS